MTVEFLLFKHDKFPVSFYSNPYRLLYEMRTSSRCLTPIRSFVLNPGQECVSPQPL